MKTHFTKDQWIGLNGGTCNKELVITTVNRRLNGVGAICEMNVTFDDDFQVEQRANADLIVAAPDMYAMLKDLLDNYDLDHEVDEDIINILKKARGES